MLQEQIRALIDEVANLGTQANAILTTARDDGDRDLTPDEEQTFDRMHSDIEKKTAKRGRLERQLELERSQLESQGARSHLDPDGSESRADDNLTDEQRAAADAERVHSSAFSTWLRFGMDGLTQEERRMFIGQGIAFDASTLSPAAQQHLRAQGVGTAGAGGATVPEGFVNKIVEAQLAYGGMRRANTTRLPTADGADLPMPTDDDTSNKGAIVAENVQVTEQDVTFSSVTFKAWMYTSKIVRVSFQLMQDSAFDLDSYLARKLGIRIGRATNEHFTTGDDSSKPEGVIVGATVGKTAASATAITYLELLDLEHSVDPDYRANAAQIMFHDNTLLAVKKLQDGDGRPIWQPSLVSGDPNTLLGYEYIINNDVATIASTAKTIAFGDFSLYHIRDVNGAQVMRLTERYADYLQVAFLAFARHDGRIVDAGTAPVKVLQQAA